MPVNGTQKSYDKHVKQLNQKLDQIIAELPPMPKLLRGTEADELRRVELYLLDLHSELYNRLAEADPVTYPPGDSYKHGLPAYYHDMQIKAHGHKPTTPKMPIYQ